MDYLELIKSNNESIEIQERESTVIIEKVWNDESISLEYSITDTESLHDISNIIFRKELFALYHIDSKMYEFVFQPLQKEYERQFDFVFNGKKFHLNYGTPTSLFKNIAQHYVVDFTEDMCDRAMGLTRYRLYYESIDEHSSELIPHFFPTNFFITGDFDNLTFNEHLELFRHVNFMLSYYDRKSPIIILYDNYDNTIDDINLPCKNKTEKFPEILNTKSFNSTLLDLMDAARQTNNSRLKYIFYFQVLEYSAYYYIENGVKRKIENIIKSPDILNSDKYTHKLIEIYSDYCKRTADEKRMEHLLSDLCTFDDIKDELKTNSKYFIQDLQFDGGFCVKKLFNSEAEIENPAPNIIVAIRKNIDSIRNVLVHARESRENLVISPTQRNAQLLLPYLYLLRRLAEIVVIKYN